jgi:hypothetical protein
MTGPYIEKSIWPRLGFFHYHEDKDISPEYHREVEGIGAPWWSLLPPFLIAPAVWATASLTTKLQLARQCLYVEAAAV